MDRLTPTEAGYLIAEALRTVPDLRVATGLGRAIAPPAAVVGPPRLEWEGYCQGPSRGRWLVYLVTSLNEFATDALLELLGSVAAAIEENTGGVVRAATPGIYPATGQGELPAYELEIEMELSG